MTVTDLGPVEPVPHLHSVDGAFPGSTWSRQLEDAVGDLLVALGHDPRDEHFGGRAPERGAERVH